MSYIRSQKLRVLYSGVKLSEHVEQSSVRALFSDIIKTETIAHSKIAVLLSARPKSSISKLQKIVLISAYQVNDTARVSTNVVVAEPANSERIHAGSTRVLLHSKNRAFKAKSINTIALLSEITPTEIISASASVVVSNKLQSEYMQAKSVNTLLSKVVMLHKVNIKSNRVLLKSLNVSDCIVTSTSVVLSK